MGYCMSLVELPRLKCLGRPCTHFRNRLLTASSKYTCNVFHINGKYKRRYVKARATRSVRQLTPVAMVNVDVSPSVILGVGLIGAGVSLWQIRQARPWISRDYDVVVSCISLLVGGILIFQGWRLDPLLLFGQLMTTGAAVSFGIEALRLRSQVYEQDEKVALQDAFRRKTPRGLTDDEDKYNNNTMVKLPLPEQSSRRKRRAEFLQDSDAVQYASSYNDYVDYADYRGRGLQDQMDSRFMKEADYEEGETGYESWYTDGEVEEELDPEEEEEYPTDGDWSVRVDRSSQERKGSTPFAIEDWD